MSKARRSSAGKVHPTTNTAPRCLVVGPGAIGCLLAAKLAEGGCDVVLLDHKPARARALTRSGLRIDTSSSSRRVRVPVVTGQRLPGEAVDYIFVCVKCHDTRNAISAAAPAIGPATIVVSMQNGLGNAEMIARFVPGSRVVCGVTGHGAINLGPGRVFHAGNGRTRVASMASIAAASAMRVARLLRRAGMHTTWMPDARAMLWGKLIVNASINPLTAVLDLQNGKLLTLPAAKGIMLRAAAEGAAVAEACGVSLPFRSPAREVIAACKATRNNISSMLQDLRGHRKTEIEYITGEVIRAARRHRVPVPVNRMLFAMISALEERSLQ
ncbi:MAG: ketopantoate reductase family protein [bacterium]